jgi:hypothetical protein
MRQILRILTLLMIALMWSNGIQASETFELYNGTRSLGMGGAAIAVVNDETSLLVNPAGLGKLRDAFGTLIDPEIEVASTFSRFYTASPFTDPTDFAKVLAAVQLFDDAYYYGKMQFFPSFVVRNFGIGLLHKKEIGSIYNTTTGLLDTNYRYDSGLILGYNFRFFDGRIKLGFNGKFIYRIEVDKELDPLGDLTLAGNASEGASIGSDVGLTLTAPWILLPTLAVVARDVGGTKFTAGSGLIMTSSTRPTEQAQKVDAAIAFFPIHNNRTRSSFTVEYRDAMNVDTTLSTTNKTHVGYELNIGDLVFMRAGYHQGQWTAGLEFASERTQLQFASYAEQVGTTVDPITNRRYVWKWAFRF